ncbi:MAG: PorT family protein [Bacteroides sp.]|nr:PorT family protein [Bacteroides sp.]
MMDWTNKLKNKMEGYTEQPSDSVWAGISAAAGLTGNKHRAVPLWLLASSAIAAAALFGAMLIFNAKEDVPATMTAEAVKVGQETVVSGRVVQDNDITSVPEVSQAGLYVETEVRDFRGAAVSVDFSDEPSDEVAVEPFGEVVGVTAETSEKNEIEGTIEPDTEEEIEPDEDGGRFADEWKWVLAEPELQRTKRGGKLAAGLSVNGSGSASSLSSRPTAATLGANPLDCGVSSADWVDRRVESVAGVIVYNQPVVTTEYSHKMPVKIGASIRYDFNKFLGIESGLTYSFLSSDLKTGEEGAVSGWSKGVQSMHYLGIPLNLSFNIFSSRYFNAYVTAGGLMEKCVRGSLKTDEYLDGKYHGSSSTSLKQKGLQWSVNGAAGIQVNILPQLGLYMEPGVSHHFSNNSKVRTIYSDKPTDFSLSFGLRYTFR